MAKSYFTIPIQHLNILHPLITQTLLSSTIIILSFLRLCITHAITIELIDTDSHLPSDDPKITNLMVSNNDCAKQHNLCQFNLINVKLCIGALSKTQHVDVKARVYVRAKA